jgi:hypothetical protein
MSDELTPETFGGFLIPQPFTADNLGVGSPWSPTYTQQGPRPGQPTPQGTYSLNLQASGSQSADSQLRIRTHKAGHPGPDGAGFVWKKNGDSLYRGRDIHQLTHWSGQILTTGSGATTSTSNPDVKASPSGQLFVAFQREDASKKYVSCSVRSTAGVFARTDIHEQTAAPPTNMAFHPGLCVLPDESVLIAHWVFDTTNNLAQIKVHRYSNGTYTVISTAALPEAISIPGSSFGSGTAGYHTLGRIRLAESLGQILMVCAAVPNDNSKDGSSYFQFVSTNGGGSFDLVEEGKAVTSTVLVGYHSLFSYNGRFYLIYLSAADDVRLLKMAHARVLISSGTTSGTIDALPGSVTVGTLTSTGGAKTYFTVGEGSFWPDSDGTIYGSVRNVGGSNGENLFLISTDRGDTWKFTGDNTSADAAWWESGSNGTIPKNYSGCSHRGRQVIYGNATTPGSADNSLMLWQLGGASTITLPGLNAYSEIYARSYWVQTWVAMCKPQNSGGPWSLSSGTDANGALNTTDKAFTITTSSAVYRIDAAPTTTNAQGMIVSAQVLVSAGGSLSADHVGLQLRLANASSYEYDVSIRLLTSGFRVYDNAASAAVGSDVTFDIATNGLDILVAMASGKIAVWYRGYTESEDRAFVAGPAGSISDAGATANNNLIRFGHPQSTSSTSKWRRVCYSVGDATGQQLAAGQTNPDDLFAIPYAARGNSSYVSDGVGITAIGGHAYEGDTVHVDTEYQYSINRIFPAQSPSTRVQWRSTAVTSGAVAEQFIPLRLTPTIADEETDLGDLIALHCSGVNFRTAQLERYDVGTAAWVVMASIDNSIAVGACARRGSTLGPTSVGATGVFLHENEAKDWNIQLGASDYRTVRGNSAGVLAGGSSSKTARLFLNDITGSESASPSPHLIPDRFTVVCSVAGSGIDRGAAWGLRIISQRTASNDIGSALCCSVAWSFQAGKNQTDGQSARASNPSLRPRLMERFILVCSDQEDGSCALPGAIWLIPRLSREPLQMQTTGKRPLSQEAQSQRWEMLARVCRDCSESWAPRLQSSGFHRSHARPAQAQMIVCTIDDPSRCSARSTRRRSPQSRSWEMSTTQARVQQCESQRFP